MAGSHTCPSDNQQAVEQGSFWGPNGIDWDAHRIGWLIAGICAAVTVLFTAINVWRHCRHYTNPPEQRQILRVLYMPPIYAVISFLSYRYFRSYTYYELVESVYESITLSAFLLLLIEFVAATASNHRIDNAISRKGKEKMPIPFCCWRYRPTKPYFMYTLKWSVLQYVIIRPLLTVIGIICQAEGVLCESGGWSLTTANAYLEIIDGASITIALYGLIIFYALTREGLKGRKPLSKFLSIKLIVMFTFYQGLVFDALEGRVIHATEYWTETNIADGLNALATCIEMVFFSAFMIYAYGIEDYVAGGRTTSIGRPLLDSINFSDFAREIGSSFRFFIAYLRREPNTHSKDRLTVLGPDGKPRAKMDFGEAFGVEGAVRPPLSARGASEFSGIGSRMSYDEDISLAPYATHTPSSASSIALESVEQQQVARRV